ncbi:MAG: DUF5671 domain-containing protein [Dehalococcoidia bacterium]
MGLLVSLILLLVVVGVIVAVVRRRRPEDGAASAPDAGLGTVRRLFLYGVGLLALVFAGIGLSLLIGGLIDSFGGETVISESDTELAFALSFSIVGVPAWLIAAFIAQRSVAAARDAEVGAELRRFYLNLARGIALVIVAVNALEVLAFALRLSDFDGGPLGWLLVWGGIWLLHDQVVRREPRARATVWLDELYLGFASVFGLGLLLTGTAGALTAALSSAYDGLFRETLVHLDWSRSLREAGAPAAVGAVVWVGHWLLQLRRVSRHRATWQVVVFLFGVLPGVAMTLVPSAIALHTLLDWWIGNPAGSAADHFAQLPDALAIAVVGLGVWVYFRSLVWEEDAERVARGDAERVYRYLVSAAGLLVLAGGIVAGLALAIEAGAPESTTVIRSEGWWREQLVMTLTLLLVGAPVWAWFWFGAQRVARSDAMDRVALPRRLYIFAIFGAATVVLLVNLTIVLFRFFDAMLGDGLSRELLVDVRWNAAFVIAAGIVAGYHWAVLREDQAAAPPEVAAPPRRRTVVLVVPPGAESLAAALADVEGLRVRVWTRAGAPDGAAALLPETREALRTLVSGAAEDSLVLVGDRGQLDRVLLREGAIES